MNFYRNEEEPPSQGNDEYYNEDEGEVSAPGKSQSKTGK